VEIELLRNALRFDKPHLPALDSAQWNRLVHTADSEKVTLALGLRYKAVLPASIDERINQNLQDTAQRHAKVRKWYEEIAKEFQAAGIEFAVLKGFSHGCGYAARALDRPSGDLDLYCPVEQIMDARDILVRLGYQPLQGTSDVPTDHIPPMIRKTPWTWRGNYFDPDAPFSVELHFQFWDKETERISLDGLDAFWTRRQQEGEDGFRFPALEPADRLGYAALHLMRHFLRGDVRLFHAYELAHFLETTHADGTFWDGWQQVHSASLRSMEAMAFRLASDWFGCRVPEQVSAEWEQFPEPARYWFAGFSQAPLRGKTHPNKNELWLHLSLVNSTQDRLAVAARRLLPVRRQKAQYAAHVPEELVTWRLRVTRKVFQARFTLRRIRHHSRSTLPTLFSGARFWFGMKGVNPQLFLFLGATSLFNIGMGIYFLLHNLFLLDRGFHEDSLGAVSSALGVGSLTGTMPAAFGLHRYGVRRLLVAAFAGVPLVSAIRVLWNTPEVLIGSAFAGGFLMSMYAVALAPTIAQWTTESARPFAFSLVFSLGIGMGIFSSLIGGHLPAILSLRNALLLACAIAALGSVIAARLNIDAPAPKERAGHIYPRSRFVGRFLIAVFLFSMATGSFNPFFSAYFSQTLHFRVNEIGFVAAAGQCVQVAAILCAPLVLSRLGVIAGVVSMQLATAVALALLSAGFNGWVAAALYALYTGFQYMSEPGTFSLLMDQVAPHERGGAAALNFLVASGTQALAALAAGFVIKNWGYTPVLVCAAVLVALAGVTFRSLLKKVPQSSGPLACNVRQ
jgi:MFS family permease